MNDKLLLAAQKWFTELGVQTSPYPTHLMVNRAEMEQVGTIDEILKELRGVLNSNRLYWGYKDNIYCHLQAF